MAKLASYLFQLVRCTVVGYLLDHTAQVIKHIFVIFNKTYSCRAKLCILRGAGNLITGPSISKSLYVLDRKSCIHSHYSNAFASGTLNWFCSSKIIVLLYSKYCAHIKSSSELSVPWKSCVYWLHCCCRLQNYECTPLKKANLTSSKWKVTCPPEHWNISCKGS